MDVDLNFDIENYMYRELKKYLNANSRFTVHIFPRSPKELAKFPTIVFREINNVDVKRKRSLDRQYRVSQITDTVEIYTKDMVIGSEKVASKVIMSELKSLIFEFFELVGAERLGAIPTEYYDRQIDRLIITVRYSQASWNRQITS